MIVGKVVGSFIETGKFLARLARVTALAGRLAFFSRAAAPVRFREFFEGAGGAFIKLGQILALRHDFLPPAYTEELLKLLASVPAVPFAAIEPVFISELGRPPADFFKTFDPNPIASASISQVYRATLGTGEAVAVKIARPGAQADFERDFVLASFLAGLAGIFRLSLAINLSEAVDEFIAWTRRELDFRYEARNGAALHHHSLEHPDTVIPKVYLQFCTERVLVTEYMRGVARLDTVISKLDKNPNLRTDLLRQYRVDLPAMAYYFIIDGMRQYFIDGFFHADPHPANIFLLPDNRLGYFDFGIMGEAGRERVELLKVMHGLATHNLEAVSKVFLNFSRRGLAPEVELFREHRRLAHAKYAKVIKKIEEIITDSFRNELAVLLLPWYEPGNGTSTFAKSASVIFSRLIFKAESYSVYLPRDITIFLRGLAIADMVALKICPEFEMIKALKMFFKEYPLERAIEMIEEKTHEAELLPGIDPVSHYDFEQVLELKARDRERLAVATERLSNLVAYYAERYPEVRKLL